MQDYRNLKVWQVAHRLVLEIYRCTRKFPKEELYGLTSQVRRAAASVPANIAEGAGRQGTRDFARFLDIASGSINELEYHLLLARDLDLLSHAEHDDLSGRAAEVRKMLTAFTQRLRPAPEL
jgi:four helix bundle protein